MRNWLSPGGWVYVLGVLLAGLIAGLGDGAWLVTALTTFYALTILLLGRELGNIK